MTSRETVEAMDMPEEHKRLFLELVDRQERNDLWDPPHVAGSDYPLNLVAEYLKRHGREWEAQELPDGVERGEPHGCYSNASRLVMSDRHLRYCEGYLHRPDALFAFLHGWVVDEDDMVIDPTVDDPETCRYWGVAYDTDEYLAYVTRTEIFGVLGGDFLNGIAVLEADGLPDPQADL